LEVAHFARLVAGNLEHFCIIYFLVVRFAFDTPPSRRYSPAPMPPPRTPLPQMRSPTAPLLRTTLPAAARPSVLIVDSSADNREVLRTVLARRGMQILEAEAAEQGLALARQHHPDVVVLDLEAEQDDTAAIRDQFSEQTPGRQKSVIILGKIRRGPTFTGGHVISKPYHFAPLIHTIEQLAAKAA
jgi:CheY-like chemotaxis protein